MKLCACGQPIKITGDKCDDCYAKDSHYPSEGAEYTQTSCGMSIAEAAKMGRGIVPDNRQGAWGRRGRRFNK
jgi:hypothetical protein